MENSKRKGCDCQECRELCWNESGWFMPEEVKTAASFLGIGESEFIQIYLEEHFEDNAIVLAPKMLKRGSCIFLENDHCAIHTVKPFECRKVYGCEEKRRHKRIREIIRKKWK